MIPIKYYLEHTEYQYVNSLLDLLVIGVDFQ
jgi:hypothetical protein